MKKHKLNCYPEMTEIEFDKLKESMVKNGFDKTFPIIVYQEAILDGYNRYRAAIITSTEPVFKHFEGSDYEAIQFVVRSNMRRNLTASQLACVAVLNDEIFKIIQDETEKIRREKISENNGRKSTTTQQIGESSDKKSHDTESSQKLAEVFGTNRTDVQIMSKLKTENKKLFDEVREGKKTKSEAIKEQKKEVVKKKEDEYKKEVKKTSDFDVDIFTTKKKFNIIYADPAWKYWEGGEKNQELHYQTMGIQEIKGLPVDKIADENCILFMWATWPILPDALEIIKHWGFKYSTAGFVWVKKNKKSDSWFFGCGSWTRANSEFCLIATKGKINRMEADISQVLDDQIAEHSEKPSRVRDLIVRLVGNLPRIELFSRNDNKDGWFNWGNKI